MKRNLTLILLTLILTNCFFSDYESERIKSSTGNFEIKAVVNRTDKNVENYEDVIILLFDIENNQLAKLNTGAGDFSKWTIGWTKLGDTIILQSSDIGNRAWVVENKIYEVEMNEDLNKRAEFLKSKKYK